MRDHDPTESITFQFSWRTNEPLLLRRTGSTVLESDTFTFTTTIGVRRDGPRRGQPYVESLRYDIGPGDDKSVGMRIGPSGDYELFFDGMSLSRRAGRPGVLTEPVKCYGFPDAIVGTYQNIDFLTDVSLRFDDLMSEISYVGPLRDRPRRNYLWRGDRPASVDNARVERWEGT